MRISTAQRTENENRIRTAMDRLPPGEIPPGGKCDVKILARESGIDRTELTHFKAQAPPRIAAQLDEIIRLCQDIQRQPTSADYRSQPPASPATPPSRSQPSVAQPQARTPRQGRPCRRRRPLRPQSGLRAHHQHRMAAPRRLRPLRPPVAPGNQPGHRAGRDRLAGRRHQPQHQATSMQRRRKTRAGPRCQPGPPPPGHPRGRRLPDSTTAVSRSWSGPFSTPLASGKFP